MKAGNIKMDEGISKVEAVLTSDKQTSEVSTTKNQHQQSKENGAGVIRTRDNQISDRRSKSVASISQVFSLALSQAELPPLNKINFCKINL